jgi:hypothetical protein
VIGSNRRVIGSNRRVIGSNGRVMVTYSPVMGSDGRAMVTYSLVMGSDGRVMGPHRWGEVGRKGGVALDGAVAAAGVAGLPAGRAGRVRRHEAHVPEGPRRRLGAGPRRRPRPVLRRVEPGAPRHMAPPPGAPGDRPVPPRDRVRHQGLGALRAGAGPAGVRAVRAAVRRRVVDGSGDGGGGVRAGGEEQR